MAQPFEHMTPLTPEILNQEGAVDSPAETPAVETPAGETPSAQTTPPAEPPKPPEVPKPDEFIENFNKRYSTQYKTDDEIKGLFTLPGKVTEFEGKLKDHDKFKTEAEQYKKELEETKTTYISDLLSNPLMKQAYVASQLQVKYPDRDKDVLAEIAMSDIDKMNDLEVIARERKMDGSKSSLADIKAVIIKNLGVDAEQKPEEWDSLVKTELELKATDARKRIKELLKGIEQPKVVTKEEREAQKAKYLEDKTKAVVPFREIYKKFDEYQNGDFKFAVPEEYKAGLDVMFNGMFIDGNLEVNEQNLATAEKLKRALFVDEYLPKMLEVKEKEVEARLKIEYDKLLHNDTPINTATAADGGTTVNPNEPGVSKFFQDQRNERVTKL